VIFDIFLDRVRCGGALCCDAKATLFAACSRYGWKRHASALMRNHCHRALGTPAPNLPAGMRWLPNMFANRFNRAVRQRGHLFQGRCQCLLIEDRVALRSVVNYIHLLDQGANGRQEALACRARPLGRRLRREPGGAR
jgi:hypothetical protein